MHMSMIAALFHPNVLEVASIVICPYLLTAPPAYMAGVDGIDGEEFAPKPPVYGIIIKQFNLFYDAQTLSLFFLCFQQVG
jgi:hypothetical protein